MTTTKTTVSSEVRSWLIVCCSDWLAARLPVEVAKRQGVDLVLDVGAHAADGGLHDVVEDVPLEPSEQ
jgi:hypothetical protein